MISPVTCILYTQDPDLVRRIRAFLRNRASVRHLDGPERLDAILEQNSPVLMVLDLRCHGTRDLLEQVKAEWPEVLIIALGIPRSEPLRDAEHAGIYAAEDVDLERRPFQALIGRAVEHLRVLEENRILRAEPSYASRSVEPRESQRDHGRSAAGTLRLLRFPRVFRR